MQSAHAAYAAFVRSNIYLPLQASRTKFGWLSPYLSKAFSHAHCACELLANTYQFPQPYGLSDTQCYNRTNFNYEVNKSLHGLPVWPSQLVPAAEPGLPSLE